jgi:hypothetical protein
MSAVTLLAPQNQATGTVAGPSSGASYTLGADRRLAVSDPGDIAAWLAAGWRYWVPPDPLEQTVTALAGLAQALAPCSSATPLDGVPDGRAVGVACTAAGTVTLTLADDTTVVIPVNAGWSELAFAAKSAVATTATATFVKLR